MTQSRLPPTSAAGRFPWSRILLLGSLALNLLIVCAVVGAVWSFSGGHAKGPSSGGRLIYLRAMPAEYRDVFRDVTRAALRDAGVTRGSERAALKRFAEILAADPIDKSALEALLAQRNDRSAKREAALRAGMMRVIGEMSAQERAQYADRLRDLAQRPKKRQLKD